MNFSTIPRAFLTGFGNRNKNSQPMYQILKYWLAIYCLNLSDMSVSGTDSGLYAYFSFCCWCRFKSYYWRREITCCDSWLRFRTFFRSIP